MKIESRPPRTNRWRTEQQDGIFYGSAGVGSARTWEDIVVALHGDNDRQERTYRVTMTEGEARQLREALDKALDKLARSRARGERALAERAVRDAKHAKHAKEPTDE